MKIDYINHAIAKSIAEWEDSKLTKAYNHAFKRVFLYVFTRILKMGLFPFSMVACNGHYSINGFFAW